ncbi:MULTISPECIES: hypothetical protein [Enterobacterales]|uniref:hypothetical protein n=1 Tax=Enterobacterales TaxID=91347 RepID=UPI000847EC67|nr:MULTISPECIES: hypothetical protein [Enterobacterales]WOO50621.1 hypothetical protein R2S03_05390 [Hafnia alvei]MCT6517994.1 hypothetical protein [Proteus vulgaris]ODQ06030.1 hypothetical protein BGK50_02600 [Shigella sp. FC130]OEI93542.1 hypothetical protein BHE86_02610 [Shigella sp. FC1655]WPF05089.1 hypothetical protein SB028_04240 [Proteus vulgaris]
MRPVYWDFSGFNLFMQSDYQDLYQLEDNSNKLYGSSNFSELDTLDWFLLDKNSHETSFLLLTVNSNIEVIKDENSYNLNELENIDFNISVNSFINKIEIPSISCFYFKSNQLISFSILSRIKYKVLISDDLYFLLDKDFSYQGYVLEKATHHIVGYNKDINSHLFDCYLEKIFSFCTEESYEKLDEQDIHSLSILNELEKNCYSNQQKDRRIEAIIVFIQLLKSNFYNIDN